MDLPSTMDLPAGLSARPLTMADAAGVTAVMAAEELADTGEVGIDVDDILGDWGVPGFDIGTSTLGVFDGDLLVAYAEYSGGDRADAAVHPSYHGRGLGTFLADWIEDHARAAGATVVGMPVPSDSPGDRLLAARGWQVRWNSWVLVLPEDRTVDARPLPAGYRIATAGADCFPAVHDVLEDAFLEWSERERESFADFEAQVVRRPGYEPWHLRAVLDTEDEVVGAAWLVPTGDDCAYVRRIAVRRDHRNRSLAQALLADAFGAARDHGVTRCELSTDSRTGALGLYEKVGMAVTSTWVNRAVEL